MNNVTDLVNKYRQAPWRVQRQWLGLFLLGIVAVAMVAALYLNVTARAALAGREIQLLRAEIDAHKLENANLETRLAILTSSETMRRRAEGLGLGPVEAEEVIYVAVEGYVPPASVDMSQRTSAAETAVILPEYTESLFEWFTSQLEASSQHAGATP
jgi:hypothetical protein